MRRLNLIQLDIMTLNVDPEHAGFNNCGEPYTLLSPYTLRLPTPRDHINFALSLSSLCLCSGLIINGIPATGLEAKSLETPASALPLGKRGVISGFLVCGVHIFLWKTFQLLVFVI